MCQHAGLERPDQRVGEVLRAAPRHAVVAEAPAGPAPVRHLRGDLHRTSRQNRCPFPLSWPCWPPRENECDRNPKCLLLSSKKETRGKRWRVNGLTANVPTVLCSCRITGINGTGAMKSPNDINQEASEGGGGQGIAKLGKVVCRLAGQTSTLMPMPTSRKSPASSMRQPDTFRPPTTCQPTKIWANPPNTLGHCQNQMGIPIQEQ